MSVVVANNELTIEFLEYGVLVASVNQEILLNRLGYNNPPHASMGATFHIPPINQLPKDLNVSHVFGQPHDEHYQMSFTLGAPFHNPDQVVPNAANDSLLILGPTPAKVTLEVQGSSGSVRVEVVLIPNESHRVSKLVVFIPGHLKKTDAEDVGFAAARTYLSQMSAVYRVPLETTLVERFHVILPNHIEYARYVIAPFQTRQLRLNDINALQVCWDFKSFARAVNHYREGSNASNPMQRFLSFYKGIEAIMALRTELGRSYKGIKFPKSLLEDNEFFRLRFPDLIGQSHTHIVSRDLLKKEYRNAVAHWGADEPLGYSSDQRSGVFLYHKLAILAETICHHLLTDTVEGTKLVKPN